MIAKRSIKYAIKFITLQKQTYELVLKFDCKSVI